MTVQIHPGITQANQFYRLVHAPGPFASIYFEDSHNMVNAAHNLDIRWRDISRALRRLGASEDLVAVVHRAVFAGDPPAGQSSRCLIATADGVHINERLSHTPDTPEVRVSRFPYLLPLLHDGQRQDRYLIVAVDHEGAELTVHQDRTEITATIAPGYGPVHKARSAEAHEYGQVQQRVDAMVDRNMRRVAERATAAADEIDAQVVFVLGDVRSRNSLISVLPHRIAVRATLLFAGTRHHLAMPVLRKSIRDELDRQRNDAVRLDIDRFRSAMVNGTAVQGLAAVCTALNEGAASTVLISDLADRTVLADSCSHLAAGNTMPKCQGTVAQSVRADEAIPFASLSTGASVTLTDTAITLSDGLGAILRR